MKISLNLFYLCLLPSFSNSFKPIITKTFPFKNYFVSSDHSLTRQNYELDNNNIVESSNDLLHKIQDYANDEIKIIGKQTVIYISEMLPHVDNIGHQVLHANNIFIKDILSNPVLTDELKRNIILFSIKLAQQGDDMGSQLLQLYYNIVDACL